MRILGIETSCDETAAAVVENGRSVLSNIISSSLLDHQKYGGIIPEIASRRQIELINQVVTKALAEAHVPLKKIDAIAVTQSPGLIGSLLVGTAFAQSLAFALSKPLVEIDHIRAHLYANFLSLAKKTTLPQLPAIGLVVSGGHTSLFHIKDFCHFRLLGETRDDAVGEAFDKIARLLNLGYPGGPVIDKLAKTGTATKLKFPCAEIPNSLDFSFSGTKTSVLYFIRDKWNKKEISLNQMAYALEQSLISPLIQKSLFACEKYGIKTLVVGGGVAANSMLRERLHSEATKKKICVWFPPLSLCTDNAAMTAGLAYWNLKN